MIGMEITAPIAKPFFSLLPKRRSLFLSCYVISHLSTSFGLLLSPQCGLSRRGRRGLTSNGNVDVTALVFLGLCFQNSILSFADMIAMVFSPLPCHWYCASGSNRADRPTNALTAFVSRPVSCCLNRRCAGNKKPAPAFAKTGHRPF